MPAEAPAKRVVAVSAANLVSMVGILASSPSDGVWERGLLLRALANEDVVCGVEWCVVMPWGRGWVLFYGFLTVVSLLFAGFSCFGLLWCFIFHDNVNVVK